MRQFRSTATGPVIHRDEWEALVNYVNSLIVRPGRGIECTHGRQGQTIGVKGHDGLGGAAQMGVVQVGTHVKDSGNNLYVKCDVGIVGNEAVYGRDHATPHVVELVEDVLLRSPTSLEGKVVWVFPLVDVGDGYSYCAVLADWRDGLPAGSCS